ncbi:hypothetical protein [Salibacterium qingdaonense]|nr:hypothetical protein [Salibacterium qingdaonense]
MIRHLPAAGCLILLMKQKAFIPVGSGIGLTDVYPVTPKNFLYKITPGFFIFIYLVNVTLLLTAQLLRSLYPHVKINCSVKESNEAGL